jgi:hypothetical protein
MIHKELYEKAKCEVCGKVFSGENAQLRAEQCRDGHERIIISLWDYELPGFISFFNTYDRALLPKGFVSKLRRLQGKALNP